MKLEKNEVKPGEGVMENGLPAKTSAGKLFGFNRIYDRTAPSSAGPYMTRMWIGRLRLHIFHRGDADPDAHDHPWPFWTFPFTSYVEEVTEWVGRESEVPPKDPQPGAVRVFRQVVPAWRWSYRPATHTHRVLGPVAPGIYGLGDGHPFAKAGKIITLVWRGKPERTWGFLRNRAGNWCWTNWREYVFGGGKDAPCGDSPTSTLFFIDRIERIDGKMVGYDSANPEKTYPVTLLGFDGEETFDEDAAAGGVVSFADDSHMLFRYPENVDILKGS